MQLMIILLSVWTASAKPALAPEREARCRATPEFHAMCALCGTGARCAADRPNHGSSPQFMPLVGAIAAMETACGFTIPADACVRCLLPRLPRICRAVEKVPDIQILVEPGQCAN